MVKQRPYCRFVRRQKSSRRDLLAPGHPRPNARLPISPGGVFIPSPLCFPRPRPSTTSSCFLITPPRSSTPDPSPLRRPQPLRFSHPHPRSASDPGRSHRVGAGSDARSLANPSREAEGLRTARPRFRSQPHRADARHPRALAIFRDRPKGSQGNARGTKGVKNGPLLTFTDLY